MVTMGRVECEFLSSSGLQLRAWFMGKPTTRAWFMENLRLGLGFGQADRALAFFPLTALLEEFDALEALENRAFAGGRAFGFESIVLGHGDSCWGGAGKLGGIDPLGKGDLAGILRR